MAPRPCRAPTCGRRPAALLAASFLLLAACGGEPPAAPTQRPDDAYTRATGFDYGGGLGGGKRAGHTVRRPDVLEIWTEDPVVGGGCRVVEKTLHLAPEVIQAVFDAAREARFLDLRLDETDDFGMGMVMTGPGGSHRVAWARAADAPRALRPVADAVLRAARAGR